MLSKLRINELVGHKGFTLLEIMVSMAILGIGLVSVIGLFSSGLKTASLSNNYTLATMLARQKMEEIASQSEISAETLSGEFEGEYSNYFWQVDIDPYEFKENLEEEAKYKEYLIKMYKIQTMVSWKQEKKNRNVKLVTLKTILEKER